MKPDKSNKAVIMNTIDYDNKMDKMDSLLSENQTYKKFCNDPTKTYHEKNNSLIRKLLSTELISENEAKKNYYSQCSSTKNLRVAETSQTRYSIKTYSIIYSVTFLQIISI